MIDIHSMCFGSSPRMWGTPSGRSRRLPGSRFIPTHVGNTRVGYLSVSGEPVHPHACGEHYSVIFIFKEIIGSSPRMWGTHITSDWRLKFYRFIPTHVGNTDGGNLISTLKPVHPHACGEHDNISVVDLKTFGSSPRMWGTRDSSFS